MKNPLFKILGIVWYPSTFEGYNINYNVRSYRCNEPGCNSITYAVHGSRYIVYCPRCQRLMYTESPTY